MTLRVKINDEEKEYTFTATMKNIVALNKKFKVNNLREAFFKAFNAVDFEFLADVLMTLADDETRKSLNNDYGKLYDLMEAYVKENSTDYLAIYSMLADEINDSSFFGKKMSKTELEKEKNNPLVGFDINGIVNTAVEGAMKDFAVEEFAGYRA